MNFELKQAYRLALAWIVAVAGGIFGLGIGMNFGGNFPVPFDYAGMPGYEGAGIFGTMAGAILANVGLIVLGSWLRGYGQIKRMLKIGLGIGVVEMFVMHFFYSSSSSAMFLIALVLIGIPALVMLLDEWMRTPTEHPRYPHPGVLEGALALIPLAIMMYFVLGTISIIG